MTFGVKLRYWLLLGTFKTVGALPDWFLYGPLRRIFYFAIYRVAQYRKVVVRCNLENSYPEKTKKELRTIEREFYFNLAEMFIDAIDLSGVSKKVLLSRVNFTNLEEHRAATQGRDWIAALAHYGSWEYFSAYKLFTDSDLAAVYRPLHNPAADAYYKYSRTRFGANVVPMNNLLRYIVRSRDRHPRRGLILGMIADQTPPKNEVHHWFRFFGQDTPFFMGVEKIAVKFGMPVYFVDVKKTSIGHYDLSFEMIFDGEEAVAEYEITERYVRRLEEMIRRRPELWMWSHRRWKHTPPKE